MIHRHSFSVLLMAGLLASPALALGQSSPAATSTTAPAGTPLPVKKRAVRKRRAPAMQVIPMETAPPTPPPAMTAAQAAQQKAADQALLQQQQAQSANAARINDQQVQRAQKQFEKQQNETSIQDAPGPVQTGVVPVAGPPVVPTSTDAIQDAPGPAQTLPKPTTPPATTPPQS